MEFKEWLQNESPIGDFELLGNWGDKAPKYGFKKDDIGILTNAKAVEKIKRQWFKTQERFDFYFLRSVNAKDAIEIGEVSEDYLRDRLKIQLQPHADAITVIFTNNTGDERIPMTGWAMAHRFGHAIRRTNEWQYFNNEFMLEFKKLLKEVYNHEIRLSNYAGTYQLGVDENSISQKAIHLLATAIGTMKSARTNDLRNFNEFQYELLAQYLLTGGIKFNPLPAQLVMNYAWGRPSNALRGNVGGEAGVEWNEVLHNIADQFDSILDGMLGGLVGRIFVM